MAGIPNVRDVVPIEDVADRAETVYIGRLSIRVAESRGAARVEEGARQRQELPGVRLLERLVVRRKRPAAIKVSQLSLNV